MGEHCSNPLMSWLVKDWVIVSKFANTGGWVPQIFFSDDGLQLKCLLLVLVLHLIGNGHKWVPHSY